MKRTESADGFGAEKSVLLFPKALAGLLANAMIILGAVRRIKDEEPNSKMDIDIGGSKIVKVYIYKGVAVGVLNSIKDGQIVERWSVPLLANEWAELVKKGDEIKKAIEQVKNSVKKTKGSTAPLEERAPNQTTQYKWVLYDSEGKKINGSKDWMYSKTQCLRAGAKQCRTDSHKVYTMIRVIDIPSENYIVENAVYAFIKTRTELKLKAICEGCSGKWGSGHVCQIPGTFEKCVEELQIHESEIKPLVKSGMTIICPEIAYSLSFEQLEAIMESTRTNVMLGDTEGDKELVEMFVHLTSDAGRQETEEDMVMSL